jgi:vacuolar-type H+-ATPase subunit I/STV1
MIKEIISTSYATLKNSKAGDFQNVKSELDLLGVNYNDDNLAIAYKLIQSSKSLRDCIVNLDKYEKSGTIDTVLSEVNIEIKARLKKEVEAAEVKKQKRKEVDEIKEKEKEVSQAVANKKKELLETAKLNNPYLHIVKYTIVREKVASNLAVEVNKLIKEGWSPIGGVTGVAFGMSTHGGNSFAQALAKFKY